MKQKLSKKEPDILADETSEEEDEKREMKQDMEGQAKRGRSSQKEKKTSDNLLVKTPDEKM